MFKHMLLTKGQIATVDAADYDRLSTRKWSASRSTDDGRYYAVAKVPGAKTTTSMHREVMQAAKGQQVDHIDGNTLNNTRANLRFATQSENLRNKGPKKGRKYKGISREKGGRFIVNLRIGGFATEKEAAVAYNEAAARCFGEFARLNVIDDAP